VDNSSVFLTRHVSQVFQDAVFYHNKIYRYFFTLGSVYNKKATGAEQTAETKNLNYTQPCSESQQAGDKTVGYLQV